MVSVCHPNWSRVKTNLHRSNNLLYYVYNLWASCYLQTATGRKTRTDAKSEITPDCSWHSIGTQLNQLYPTAALQTTHQTIGRIKERQMQLEGLSGAGVRQQEKPSNSIFHVMLVTCDMPSHSQQLRQPAIKSFF